MPDRKRYEEWLRLNNNKIKLEKDIEEAKKFRIPFTIRRSYVEMDDDQIESESLALPTREEIKEQMEIKPQE